MRRKHPRNLKFLKFLDIDTDRSYQISIYSQLNATHAGEND